MNRSMVAKHLKAKKEAIREVQENQNIFAETSFCKNSRQSSYDWLHGPVYGKMYK